MIDEKEILGNCLYLFNPWWEFDRREKKKRELPEISVATLPYAPSTAYAMVSSRFKDSHFSIVYVNTWKLVSGSFKNIIDSLGARQLDFFFLSHCKVKGLAISLWVATNIRCYLEKKLFFFGLKEKRILVLPG
jgi:hypothetical protein